MQFRLLFPAALILLLFTSCEKEFIPDIQAGPERIVVEGYIEAGDRPRPAYVILTRNVPFFTELKADDLGDIFVHDAVVTVSDGEKEATLTEVCLNDLTPDQRKLAASLLGFSADTIAFNLCAYIDLGNRMPGVEGRRYELKVDAGGRKLNAVTTIPPLVRLDSLRFFAPPGERNDTLAQLRCSLSDPPGAANYYRYFVGINGGSLQTGFNSVFEDRLFDGQRFRFPLPRPSSGNQDVEPSTFGLYTIGDTVAVKWASIDRAHFDFWNTLEFNSANQGPFSSYTRVKSNIDGGLGVWGGSSAGYYLVKVEIK